MSGAYGPLARGACTSSSRHCSNLLKQLVPAPGGLLVLGPASPRLDQRAPTGEAGGCWAAERGPRANSSLIIIGSTRQSPVCGSPSPSQPLT